MIQNETISNIDISQSAAIAIGKLAARTISGKDLGTNLDTLTIGAGLTGGSYNGSSPVNIAISSSVTTNDGTQILTNKRIDPRVFTWDSPSGASGFLEPDSKNHDLFVINAQNTISITPIIVGIPNGAKMLFRIKDNGTARTINWSGPWKSIGVTIPASTTVGKLIYVGAIYNSATSQWDVVAVNIES
jgi:hypothetical protein